MLFSLYLKRGATLIADGNDLAINRKLNEAIPERAELYAVCDQATYQKIMSKGE
ncbi:voltage-gated potassium channel [Halobacillus karajensis]|uniref:Uncharacterized protein n=1 Tax=Halobacillus karajensis TaxID=195088 RepID=A0A024P8P8_9BACI|nr:hypothetical protein BN982_00609 [Halobacillus karajensis]CDQ24702.1 hypothetical protein BN983_02997 [Halobacillus karajensis]CDQ29052.1 hypothetical protein BN981_03412 [Halobacillus karajensis]SEI06699.1 voltage-gated potassium channel [Halobacillus karajensis]